MKRTKKMSSNIKALFHKEKKATYNKEGRLKYAQETQKLLFEIKCRFRQKQIILTEVRRKIINDKEKTKKKELPSKNYKKLLDKKAPNRKKVLVKKEERCFLKKASFFYNSKVMHRFANLVSNTCQHS